MEKKFADQTTKHIALPSGIDQPTKKDSLETTKEGVNISTSTFITTLRQDVTSAGGSVGNNGDSDITDRRLKEAEDRLRDSKSSVVNKETDIQKTGKGLQKEKEVSVTKDVTDSVEEISSKVSAIQFVEIPVDGAASNHRLARDTEIKTDLQRSTTVPEISLRKEPAEETDLQSVSTAYVDLTQIALEEDITPSSLLEWNSNKSTLGLYRNKTDVRSVGDLSLHMSKDLETEKESSSPKAMEKDSSAEVGHSKEILVKSTKNGLASQEIETIVTTRVALGKNNEIREYKIEETVVKQEPSKTVISDKSGISPSHISISFGKDNDADTIKETKIAGKVTESKESSFASSDKTLKDTTSPLKSDFKSEESIEAKSEKDVRDEKPRDLDKSDNKVFITKDQKQLDNLTAKAAKLDSSLTKESSISEKQTSKEMLVRDTNKQEEEEKAAQEIQSEKDREINIVTSAKVSSHTELDLNKKKETSETETISKDLVVDSNKDEKKVSLNHIDNSAIASCKENVSTTEIKTSATKQMFSEEIPLSKELQSLHHSVTSLEKSNELSEALQKEVTKMMTTSVFEETDFPLTLEQKEIISDRKTVKPKESTIIADEVKYRKQNDILQLSHDNKEKSMLQTDKNNSVLISTEKLNKHETEIGSEFSPLNKKSLQKQPIKEKELNIFLPNNEIEIEEKQEIELAQDKENLFPSILKDKSVPDRELEMSTSVHDKKQVQTSILQEIEQEEAISKENIVPMPSSFAKIETTLTSSQHTSAPQKIDQSKSQSSLLNTKSESNLQKDKSLSPSFGDISKESKIITSNNKDILAKQLVHIQQEFPTTAKEDKTVAHISSEAKQKQLSKSEFYISNEKEVSLSLAPGKQPEKLQIKTEQSLPVKVEKEKELEKPPTGLEKGKEIPDVHKDKEMTLPHADTQKEAWLPDADVIEVKETSLSDSNVTKENVVLPPYVDKVKVNEAELPRLEAIKEKRVSLPDKEVLREKEVRISHVGALKEKEITLSRVDTIKAKEVLPPHKDIATENDITLPHADVAKKKDISLSPVHVVKETEAPLLHADGSKEKEILLPHTDVNVEKKLPKEEEKTTKIFIVEEKELGKPGILKSQTEEKEILEQHISKEKALTKSMVGEPKDKELEKSSPNKVMQKEQKMETKLLEKVPSVHSSEKMQEDKKVISELAKLKSESVEKEKLRYSNMTDVTPLTLKEKESIQHPISTLKDSITKDVAPIQLPKAKEKEPVAISHSLNDELPILKPILLSEKVTECQGQTVSDQIQQSLPTAQVSPSHTKLTKSHAIITKPETYVVKPEHIAIEPEAVVVKPEPVVNKPEAIVVKPESVVTKPEAIVVKPVPVVDSRETEISKQETTVKPKSVLDKVETVVKPEPVRSKSETVVPKQESVIIKSEPVVAVVSKPESVVAKSGPVLPKSETVVSKSEPIIAKVDTIVTKSEAILSETESVLPKPDAPKSEPVTTKVETAICKAEPATTRTETIVTESVSVITKPEIVLAKPETITTKSESVLVKSEPLVAKPEAIVTKSEVIIESVSTVTKPEGVLAKAETITSKSEPSIVRLETTVDKSASVVVKPENVVDKSEPVVVKPETVVDKSEPVVIKPETIVDESEPVVVKPESVLVEPETIVDKLNTVVAKPETIVAKPEIVAPKPEDLLEKPVTAVAEAATVISDTKVVQKETTKDVKEKPLAQEDEPVAQPEPVIAKPEVTLIKPETIASDTQNVQQETVTDVKEESLVQVNEHIGTPESVLTKPETVIAEPETIIAKPKPVVTEPETVVPDTKQLKTVKDFKEEESLVQVTEPVVKPEPVAVDAENVQQETVKDIKEESLVQTNELLAKPKPVETVAPEEKVQKTVKDVREKESLDQVNKLVAKPETAVVEKVQQETVKDIKEEESLVCVNEIVAKPETDTAEKEICLAKSKPVETVVPDAKVQQKMAEDIKEEDLLVEVSEHVAKSETIVGKSETITAEPEKVVSELETVVVKSEAVVTEPETVMVDEKEVEQEIVKDIEEEEKLVQVNEILPKGKAAPVIPFIPCEEKSVPGGETQSRVEDTKLPPPESEEIIESAKEKEVPTESYVDKINKEVEEKEVHEEQKVSEEDSSSDVNGAKIIQSTANGLVSHLLASDKIQAVPSKSQSEEDKEIKSKIITVESKTENHISVIISETDEKNIIDENSISDNSEVKDLVLESELIKEEPEDQKIIDVDVVSSVTADKIDTETDKAEEEQEKESVITEEVLSPKKKGVVATKEEKRKKKKVKRKEERVSPEKGRQKVIDDKEVSEKLPKSPVKKRITRTQRTFTKTEPPSTPDSTKAPPSPSKKATPQVLFSPKKAPYAKNGLLSPSKTLKGDQKKIPPIKAPVGLAPNPRLKNVKSKVGSFDNIHYKPKGGDKKVRVLTIKKLEWHALPKVKSLENAGHRPGGGDKKIITQKLEFKEKAQSKHDEIESDTQTIEALKEDQTSSSKDLKIDDEMVTTQQLKEADIPEVTEEEAATEEVAA